MTIRPTVAGRDHRLRGGARHQERAARVDGVDGVPDLDPLVEEIGMGRDGRVVDADIERAEAGHVSATMAVRAVLGADIGDQRHDPLRIESLARLGQSLGVTVGRKDLAPLSAKRSTITRPIPRAPPVTMTTIRLKSNETFITSSDGLSHVAYAALA